MSIVSKIKYLITSTNSMKHYCEVRTCEELNELLTDVINEREAYPEDAVNDNTQFLDELYLEITNQLANRASLTDKDFLVYMINTYIDEKYGCPDDDNSEEIKRDILTATGMTESYFEELNIDGF